MSLNGIESRSLSPPMDWDLEHNAIVNLKEKFDPRDICPELERTSKAYFCNSRLRAPGDRVRKYGIRPVEIYDAIAELISDSKCSVNLISNPVVPVVDSGVKGEPALLPRLASREGPCHTGVEVEVSSRAKIIGPVDESFERFIHSALRRSWRFVVTCGG